MFDTWFKYAEEKSCDVRQPAASSKLKLVELEEEKEAEKWAGKGAQVLAPQRPTSRPRKCRGLTTSPRIFAPIFAPPLHTPSRSRKHYSGAQRQHEEHLFKSVFAGEDYNST